MTSATLILKISGFGPDIQMIMVSLIEKNEFQQNFQTIMISLIAKIVKLLPNHEHKLLNKLVKMGLNMKFGCPIIFLFLSDNYCI